MCPPPVICPPPGQLPPPFFASTLSRYQGGFWPRGLLTGVVKNRGRMTGGQMTGRHNPAHALQSERSMYGQVENNSLRLEIHMWKLAVTLWVLANCLLCCLKTTIFFLCFSTNIMRLSFSKHWNILWTSQKRARAMSLWISNKCLRFHVKIQSGYIKKWQKLHRELLFATHATDRGLAVFHVLATLKHGDELYLYLIRYQYSPRSYISPKSLLPLIIFHIASVKTFLDK